MAVSLRLGRVEVRNLGARIGVGTFLHLAKQQPWKQQGRRNDEKEPERPTTRQDRNLTRHIACQQNHPARCGTFVGLGRLPEKDIVHVSFGHGEDESVIWMLPLPSGGDEGVLGFGWWRRQIRRGAAGPVFVVIELGNGEITQREPFFTAAEVQRIFQRRECGCLIGDERIGGMIGGDFEANDPIWQEGELRREILDGMPKSTQGGAENDED